MAPPEGQTWPADVRVTGLIDGASGASLLGEPGGAHAVGRLCGDASRRIAAIDGSGAGLADLWADPERLAVAVGGWAADLASDLAKAEQAALWRAVGELPRLLAGRPVVMAHGDLVPVNVLVRDGLLAGLLDLDGFLLADPLFDAAWFDHIVGFHHSGEHIVARAGFAEGSRLDLDGAGAVSIMRALTAARLLEILGGLQPDSRSRQVWLKHLRFALESQGRGADLVTELRSARTRRRRR